MTAFARCESNNKQGSFSWDIRSLNSRFLDINLRLPEIFNPLEMKLRDALKHQFSRGKFDCALRFNRNLQESSLIISNERASDVIRAVYHINKIANNNAPLNPFEVLNFDGVLQADDISLEPIHESAMHLFEQTLTKLKTARMREGKQLAQLILERLALINEELETLELFLPQMRENWRTKIVQRISDLTELKTAIDPMRLEQELAIMLHKTDAAEEIDRLKLHTAELARILNSNKAMGRKLDFLLQELGREANTLSAKAYDMRTTNIAIEIKVWLEQIREQVQNIE